MPRSGVNGTYTLPPGTDNQQPLTVISSAMFNGAMDDVEQTFNTPTPEAYGGTGASTFAQARDNLGLEIGVDIPSNAQLASASALSSMNARPSLIVNGNFQMSQENGDTLGTTNNYYWADQFFMSYTTTGAGRSVQRVSLRTLAGNNKMGEYKCTTAKPSLGATDSETPFSTIIEGSRPDWIAAAFGTANAKPFVHRMEMTLPAGLFHVHFQNSAGNRHCAVPFTVQPADANVQKVWTIVCPPDTSGTWLFGDGDKGLIVEPVLAAGATLTGGTASTWGATARLAATTQFNILSSTSNVARIADVGLKNDPDATAVYGLFNVSEVHPVYRSERYALRQDVSLGLTFNPGVTYYNVIRFPYRMAKFPSLGSGGQFFATAGASGTPAVSMNTGNTVTNDVIALINSANNWNAGVFISFGGVFLARL